MVSLPSEQARASADSVGEQADALSAIPHSVRVDLKTGNVEDKIECLRLFLRNAWNWDDPSIAAAEQKARQCHAAYHAKQRRSHLKVVQ